MNYSEMQAQKELNGAIIRALHREATILKEYAKISSSFGKKDCATYFYKLRDKTQAKIKKVTALQVALKLSMKEKCLIASYNKNCDLYGESN